ncbi:MAG: phosphomannomutase/phosphoglucomutase [Candidatus Bathyarchaeota archaeon]
MTWIFRAYDIRGVYGKELTLDTALNIGLAFGSIIEENIEVTVGWDSRLSSPALKSCISAGVAATGHKCTEVGLVPTPLLYFSTIHYGVKAGVMVTASHNPPEYNGFKLCKGGVAYSYETGIGNVEETFNSKNFKIVSWDRVGSIGGQNIIPDYLEYVRKIIKIEKKLKVVVDAGNGTCGFVGKIFEEMGCEAKVLFEEPDGRFPNHIPDPLKSETLKVLCEEVVKEKADVGIAFDGDGDRVGFVDETGKVVEGDLAFMLFVEESLKRYPNSKIVFNVLGSKALLEVIEMFKGKPLMTRVGHSYIHETLIKENASLAGEVSGHYYFGKDYYGFDDGVFAALKLAEILSKSGKTFSQLLERFPRYYTSPEIRITCADEKKFKVVDFLKTKFKKEGLRIITIDGVRVEFEDGWGLVRASNTEPALVLRFEAVNKERLNNIKQKIMDEVKETIKKFS